jgi:hypothetical protein
MDLFFTHYFVGGTSLYVSKSNLKNATAAPVAEPAAAEANPAPDTTSMIASRERDTAYNISINAELPQKLADTDRGALTVSLFNKHDRYRDNNKRKLYSFLLNAYDTSRVQYYLDAAPISPSDLCALDQNSNPIAGGIFYNGIGRMYDPGNSSGIFVKEAILKKTASCDRANGINDSTDGNAILSPVRTAQSAKSEPNVDIPPLLSASATPSNKEKVYPANRINAKATEAPCYFSPERSYSLSKADGELLFFDKLIFGDKCPPKPKEIEITAVIGNKRVPLSGYRIVRMTSSQNGISSYMIAAGNVIEAANKPVLSPNDRLKILSDLQKAGHSVILRAFRIAYEPKIKNGSKPLVSKTTKENQYYSLSARDYSMALLDIKRSGDYGLVSAAAAATLAMDPKDTVPIVVTLDRMAALYALYRGVACMYVVNLKDMPRYAKLFNFDQESLAATQPKDIGDSRIPERLLARRPAPEVPAPAPAATGGAGALASPARPAARPVTRMSSRLQPVAPPVARPSTAPAPAAPFAARPSDSASRRARPAVPRGPPAPAAPAALPAPAADAPDAEFARYSAMRFPPFARFADMLADIAGSDPEAAELLSPVNMLTYSFLHHYLRND